MKRLLKWLSITIFGGFFILLSLGLAIGPAPKSNAAKTGPENCADPDACRKANELAYANAQRKITVADAVAYLNDLPEVAGVRVIDGNHIWIAFRESNTHLTVTRDELRTIAHAAVYQANRRTGFGAHIYVTSIAQLDSVPDVSLLCTATARYGKVSYSDC